LSPATGGDGSLLSGVHADDASWSTGPGWKSIVSLPRGLRDEIVAWARAGYPNEAWGIVAGTAPPAEGGTPLRFHPMTNAAASPYRYRDDPQEQLRVMLAIEDAGEVAWGIFHSHVRSPAEPSPTDLGLAFYPDSLYLICSLADMDAPAVRAWSIRDGKATEVPFTVE
jgi:[CysO sulfur-carrier protein]-S-L-cysteine hydrolase